MSRITNRLGDTYDPQLTVSLYLMQVANHPIPIHSVGIRSMDDPPWVSQSLLILALDTDPAEKKTSCLGVPRQITGQKPGRPDGAWGGGSALHIVSPHVLGWNKPGGRRPPLIQAPHWLRLLLYQPIGAYPYRSCCPQWLRLYPGRDGTFLPDGAVQVPFQPGDR